MWTTIAHWFVTLTLTKVLSYFGAALIFQQIMEKFFGVTLLGKKLYKGAPTIWKMWISRVTFRKEVTDTLSALKKDIHFNGGASIKDIVTRIENKLEIHTDLFKDMKSMAEFNALRLDLYDESNDRMIFRLNETGECTFMNDSFLKFFGYSERDVLKFNYENIICPEHLNEVREKLQRAIETKSVFNSTHCIKDIAGASIDCCVKAYPIPKPDGKVIYYGTIDLINF